ncbi:MAG: DUF4390 domain-containing protein [Desulfobacterales bacterium]|nr:MAG: DUF4390 domain-containing protein [Desulfobacterales bacterium]
MVSCKHITLLTKRKILVSIICFLLTTQAPGFAEDARLTNITVSNTRDDLLLYLNVEGAFREEMKKAILNGVPATFSFFASMNRVRNFWFDGKIADIEVTHTINYDNLKKEFSIHRSWEGNNNNKVTKSFKEAQKLMTEINSLKIIPLNRLQKGRQYQLRVKAEFSKKTLPLYLHYVLFFVSLWDFETDWYTIDFIY